MKEGGSRVDGGKKCVAVAAACPNEEEGAYMWSLPDSDVKGLAYHARGTVHILGQGSSYMSLSSEFPNMRVCAKFPTICKRWTRISESEETGT